MTQTGVELGPVDLPTYDLPIEQPQVPQETFLERIAAAQQATEKAGLDAATLVEILAESAATSRMLQVRGPSMAASSYQTPMMKVDVFQKDLGIIANFARESHAAVPLFNASVPLFADAVARGMGAYDTAAVIAVLRTSADLQ